MNSEASMDQSGKASDQDINSSAVFQKQKIPVKIINRKMFKQIWDVDPET